MNTEAVGVPARSPSPAAERMRRHRERRRKGLHYFRVELRVTQVDMLVSKGYTLSTKSVTTRVPSNGQLICSSATHFGS